MLGIGDSDENIIISGDESSQQVAFDSIPSEPANWTHLTWAANNYSLSFASKHLIVLSDNSTDILFNEDRSLYWKQGDSDIEWYKI